MSATGLFYTNEKHAKTQPRVMDFTINITGAKAGSIYPQGADCYFFWDSVTQNQIDTYLGSSTDFNANLFDSTAMGNDAFGGIIRMSGAPSTYGQASAVLWLEAKCYSSAGLTTLVERAAYGSPGLTASTLETAVGVSTLGNIGFKVDFGNSPDFDGLTSGLIRIRIGWIAK